MRLHEVTVTTVGRQYVTIGEGSRSHKFENHDSDMLLEKANYGEITYLFKTRQEAEDYIENEQLRVWLSSVNAFSSKYTLEQLRKVKEILEG